MEMEQEKNKIFKKFAFTITKKVEAKPAKKTKKAEVKPEKPNKEHLQLIVY